MNYKDKKYVEWEKVKHDIRKSKYLPKKTDYRLEMYGLIIALVAFMGALMFFHYEVLMPHLDEVIPTASAMTNEEACAGLERYSNYQQAKEYCDAI